jgi:undecaprenyl-diphosphatase
VTILDAFLLGLVQGLTEFIPVSSSGHLLVLHEILGVTQGGLAFDVALHIGTLLALVGYFYRDIWELALGLFGKNDKGRLAWLLVLATIPAVIAGVLLQDLAESTFRSAALVAANMAVMAILMILAERYATRYAKHADLTDVTTAQAAALGSAQALALVPGVSRSGSTITAGLFLGLDRVAATRFSFLLAIPITFGAIMKVMLDGGATSIHLTGGPALVGIVTALISGLLAIRFLLNYLSKHSLAAFAYYRIAFAAIVLMLLAFR